MPKVPKRLQWVCWKGRGAFKLLVCAQAAGTGRSMVCACRPGSRRPQEKWNSGLPGSAGTGNMKHGGQLGHSRTCHVFLKECLERFEAVHPYDATCLAFHQASLWGGFPPDKQTMMRGVPTAHERSFSLSIRTTRHSHMKMSVGRKCLLGSISLTFDVVANPCCSLTGHSPRGEAAPLLWLPRHKVLLR